MSGRLTGLRIVVVGAGQSDGQTLGFGRAISALFAREDAELLLVDRELARVQTTAASIEEDHPAHAGKVICHQADITSAADVDTIAAAAREQLGGVDVLVNNVGILGIGTVTDADEALWDRVMDTNLKGMWMTCKAIIPLMIDAGGGSIVNMSSTGSHRGVSPAYCASKAGVNSLTRSIATGYGRFGIRANSILPGFIDTPMAIDGTIAIRGGSREELVEAGQRRTPLAYKGSAWDVAYAALYLASDESKFISANELVVDGGSLAML